jgi:hypothetical protein
MRSRSVISLSASFIAFGLGPWLVHADADQGLEAATANAPASRRLDAKDEAELARSTRLETVVRVALERNRDLA